MEPKWLAHAREDEGVKEVRGGENPRIIQMHSYTTLHAKEDEIAWCSAAVCAWMEEVGIESTKSAAAISWATWGIGLESPRLGCVCVIRQKRKGEDKATGSTSGNHVALWLSEQDGRVHLWGGNQGDMVKESSFGLANYEIVAYRWPEGETA
jgi:uncharacterized protein (TIGR02594 family)